ncbi:MAG: hypothetical protein KatS3mg109_2022 [Pirellulaceae bacterium]|nr:MAG: hypothetical protein KatS3mg109_1933 [Pirellulaceae bacterium]GIW91590.1 MAG: hypothetical protein KatS3mg109_2022 [Pirellulaceae bacterium]
MPIVRYALVVALLPLVAFAPSGAGKDEPRDDNNWLNEETWPEFVAARSLDISDNDDALTKLLKERYNAGQDELRSRYVYWLQDAQSLPQVYDAARRVVEARLEAGGPRSELVTVLKEKLAFAKFVEKQAVEVRNKYRRARHEADVKCATYFRAAAEIELLRVLGTSEAESPK